MRGATWDELFILFDTDGYRGTDEESIMDVDTTQRVEASRNAKAKRNVGARHVQRLKTEPCRLSSLTCILGGTVQC